MDAALEVHRHLGPWFAENVDENALCHELFVAGRLVVELEALPALAPVHTAQVISYRKATGLTLGLLVHFGERQLRTGLRRLVLTA